MKKKKKPQKQKDFDRQWIGLQKEKKKKEYRENKENSCH